MAEYIDRDDAVKAILKWEDKPCFSFLAIARDVMNVPAADVVNRRQGKWLRTPTYWAYCSCCGEEPPCGSNFRTRYCPNCGAEMENYDKLI